MTFNQKLAKRIANELKEGKQKLVRFEEFAGTEKSFIDAAKEAGLTIIEHNGNYVVVKK